MTSKKSTKSALLTSSLALLLCFTMLLGTTFAWFTDTVTSANNIIKSGNLDVEFEYWNGSTWETVQGASDILTNTLWEPGVTEVAYLKVANAGSLALKYQLGVNIVSEKEGTNVEGNTFKLSDSLMFGMIEGKNGETDAFIKDDTGREAAIASGKVNKINVPYTKDSKIVAGGADEYFALVVYMPTTVGNEANYKTSEDSSNPDKYRPQINLGINVLATQLNAEADSFGTDYDKNAKYPPVAWDGSADKSWFDASETEFTISNAEQLASIAELGSELGGKTVILDSDIDLGGVNWTPITVFSPEKSFTFDGGNHTIFNLKIDGGSDKGLFDGCVGTIKNLTISDAQIKSSGGRSAILAGRHYGDIINCHVKNSTIEDSYWAVGGIVGQLNSGDIKNCSVTNVNVKSNGGVGGIVGVLNETKGTRNIENCSVIGGTVENTGLYGSSYTGGGIVGIINISNSTVNIKGCSSTATLNGQYIYDICHPVDTDITLNIN